MAITPMKVLTVLMLVLTLALISSITALCSAWNMSLVSFPSQRVTALSATVLSMPLLAGSSDSK